MGSYCNSYKKFIVINLAKRMYYDRKISDSINKSKHIWTLIKDELGKSDRRHESIAINSNGYVISESTQVATLFSTCFTEVVERLQCNFTPGTPEYSNTNSKVPATIFYTPTNDEEITSIIKDLKNKKSSGLDGCSSFIIKKCSTFLIKPLTFLTNLSLSTGKVPESLKISKIKPVLKKGSANEIENYRPTSLISSFSKILEKVVHNRLKFFFR
jgi:Notch-like protein